MPASFWTFEPMLFASVFGLIFLAEIPDKSALSTLVMASRRPPLAVFLGTASAFVVHCVVAVGLGGALSLLPARAVRLGAGLLFLGFAWRLWREKAEEEVGDVGRGADFARTVRAAFVMTFVAEWGDLTQLATAALAAERGRPLTVFLGSVSALWSVTALAVVLGHQVKGRFHPPHVQKAAALVFALVGLSFLASGL